jgi:hypothetical protein
MMEQCFDKAETLLHVPKLLDPIELSSGKTDEKSIFIYISFFDKQTVMKISAPPEPKYVPAPKAPKPLVIVEEKIVEVKDDPRDEEIELLRKEIRTLKKTLAFEREEHTDKLESKIKESKILMVTCGYFLLLL